MSDFGPVESLHHAAVLVDDLPLELIHAQGADRIAFLHRLLSGNVAGTAAGYGCHALLLDAKGHVQSDLEIYVGDNHAKFVVAAGQGASSVAALGRYAIMDDFSAALVPDHAALAVLGPKAESALTDAQVAMPPELSAGLFRAHREHAPWWIIRTQSLGVAGYQVWGPRLQVAALAERLRTAGIPALSPETTETLRIAAGEPRFGVEITPDRFPMELGLDDAIDYSKGCYLGQEPIVRIRDRGHVNWGLRRLRFEPGSPVPAPGDKLETDARPAAGHITSAGFLSGSAGAPAQVLALALVHNSVPEGDPVRVRTAESTLVAQVLSLKPASSLDRGALD